MGKARKVARRKQRRTRRKIPQKVDFISNDQKSKDRGDSAIRVQKTYVRMSMPTGRARKTKARWPPNVLAEYQADNSRSKNGKVVKYTGISLVEYLAGIGRVKEAKTVLEDILDGKREPV